MRYAKLLCCLCGDLPAISQLVLYQVGDQGDVIALGLLRGFDGGGLVDNFSKYQLANQAGQNGGVSHKGHIESGKVSTTYKREAAALPLCASEVTKSVAF